MSCGTNSSGSALAQQTQQQQDWTNQAVKGINSAFSGFNPQFYQGVQNTYNQYALPQLQQQYQTANNQLGYKLGGQGLLNSSAAQQAKNALSSQMSQNQSQIGNQAVGQANQLKQQVAQQQANLIGEAQTASDPGSVTNQAIASASSFASPSTFAPIGQMFTNFGNQYLNNQNANLYNSFAQMYLNSLNNPSLFGQGQYSATQGF